MENAALAAVHRVEEESLAAFLDALRRSLGGHAQLLNPEHAIVIGIETKTRMIFLRHPQMFLSEQLQR